MCLYLDVNNNYVSDIKTYWLTASLADSSFSECPSEGKRMKIFTKTQSKSYDDQVDEGLRFSAADFAKFRSGICDIPGHYYPQIPYIP